MCPPTPGLAGGLEPGGPRLLLGAAVRMLLALAAPQLCRATPTPSWGLLPQVRSCPSPGQPPPLHTGIHILPQQELLPLPRNHK